MHCIWRTALFTRIIRWLKIICILSSNKPPALTFMSHLLQSAILYALWNILWTITES